MWSTTWYTDCPLTRVVICMSFRVLCGQFAYHFVRTKGMDKSVQVGQFWTAAIHPLSGNFSLRARTTQNSISSYLEQYLFKWSFLRNDHQNLLWSYIWPLKPLDVGADRPIDDVKPVYSLSTSLKRGYENKHFDTWFDFYHLFHDFVECCKTRSDFRNRNKNGCHDSSWLIRQA